MVLVKSEEVKRTLLQQQKITHFLVPSAVKIEDSEVSKISLGRTINDDDEESNIDANDEEEENTQAEGSKSN